MATRKNTTKSAATKKPVSPLVVEKTITGVEEVNVPVSEPRKFAQNDLVLCRSVTPGGLIVNGRSGLKYVFTGPGDECEIEFQDLNALKNSHSNFLYKPLMIIEDEELLENPRWTDLAKFYEEKVYGMDDVEEILNMPISNFKSALEKLPKGLLKQVQLVISQRMEEGTFDSLNKIKAMDEVCGTEFMKMLPR